MSTDATMRARDVLRKSNSHFKLPPISDLMPTNALPTPPLSSEIEKRHSFSHYSDDERGSYDHLGAPMYGPVEYSPRPSMFAPIYHDAYDRRSTSPSRHSPIDRAAFLNKTLSAIASDFEYAIAQHSNNFRARHPTFRGPSIEDYHTVAAFNEQVHRRAAEDFQHHQSPSFSPRHLMSGFHSARPAAAGRVLAPRPLFTASPVSQHSPLASPPSKRFQRASTADSTPMKRARLSSTVSFDAEDDDAESPRKKRRSTPASTSSASRRRSSTVTSMNKETKHNRNRSTKEKKSTDYRDYPADIAPAFDTMQNPMAAAAQCPEHNVANPRNLSGDPLKDELHESERTVAQKLNIDCAYFLCVKRQIFQRYLEHLKTKAFNWNKTAAQQCSNVDVGKTSQIFMFFLRVGWFREELYEGKI
ncbi:MAG: hypothetical protein Q9162_007616 [Coniocarpon cinnabarinum]